MPITGNSIYTARICVRCIRLRAKATQSLKSRRRFSLSACILEPKHPGRHDGELKPQGKRREGEEAEASEGGGAMSRRLEQMTEESLETRGSAAQKAINDAGFDQELRKRLMEKIAAASATTNSIRSEHPAEFAQVEMPAAAGRGTRALAEAVPRTGTESLEDAALRMLTDAHKPLASSSSKTKTPALGRSSGLKPPTVIASTKKKKKVSSGTRLANARDRSSIYSTLKDAGMTPEERDQYFKEMKERFQPGARSLPATLQGLASLANERIEDAIARGQFKNLPRGKVIQRDHNSSNPFINTTEYLMNSMVKKQNITPPWIEKQQERASAARAFRSRLRSDWKRHAARMIASKGGSLEEQMQRAGEHAAAEAAEAIPNNEDDKSDSVNNDEHMSQILPTGELRSGPVSGHSEKQISSPAVRTQTSYQPFRDPAWEAIEHSYHKATISSLNALTRSYNLIAPPIAQKPYFNLARELKACYMDMAPLIPAEIRHRATARRIQFENSAQRRSGGILERLDTPRDRIRIHDEDLRKKGYSFKQLWRDIWRRGNVE